MDRAEHQKLDEEVNILRTLWQIISVLRPIAKQGKRQSIDQSFLFLANPQNFTEDLQSAIKSPVHVEEKLN